MRFPRSRVLRPLVCCALVGVLAWGAAPDAARARQSPRVGVFTIGEGPGVEAALAGLREGFRIGRDEPTVLESSADVRDEAADSALSEFAFERVDVVFAFGAEAAVAARDRLGTPAVVFAAVGYPAALGLPGRGNVCGVAGGVPPAEIASWMRRCAPAARRVLLLGSTIPPGLPQALEKAHFEATPRAAAAAGAVDEPVPEGIDVVWLAPDVGAADADRVARGLRERGVLLVGSRAEHVDAGCPLVVLCDPRDEGLLAAALARRVLDGEAPGEIGVRAVARRRVIVNLDAARRLRHEIPLAVVATADRALPALGERR